MLSAARLITLSFAVALCLIAGRVSEASTATVSALETTIARLMAAGDVAGLHIVLIEDYRIRFHRGFGLARRGTGQRIDDRTVFEAASLSKPLLGYVALNLAERGLLDLDAPLASYDPAYLKSLAERDGRVNLITARRVLSHTTGFQNEIHAGQEPRIHFHPGARFSYSGEGFHYLQRAIERITGERIDVVFERMIFAPLRMESASFLWQAAYEQSKAYGHNAGGTAMERVRPAEVRLSWLHLTSIDYANFLLAAMNEVRTSRGPTNLMLSPQVPIDESCVFCLQSAGEPRSRSLAWGLGWGLEHVGTRTAIWHWGENRGEFQHFVIAYPREGTGLVIFTNSGNGFSIIPEIVSAALGGRVPASFAWLRYDRYDAPGKVMYRDILSRGVAAAEEHLGKLRAAARDGTELLSEPQVNQIGYWLLSSDRVEEAIRLFRFNVEQHPASWNAYDSLAEAHALQGDRVLAIENYAKAVELNPHNQNAIEQLRRLRQTP